MSSWSPSRTSPPLYSESIFHVACPTVGLLLALFLMAKPEIQWLTKDTWLGVSWRPVMCPLRDTVGAKFVKLGAGTGFIDKETCQSVAVPAFYAPTSHAYSSQCWFEDCFSCPYTITWMSSVIWDSQGCLQHPHRAARNRSSSGRSLPFWSSTWRPLCNRAPSIGKWIEPLLCTVHGA